MKASRQRALIERQYLFVPHPSRDDVLLEGWYSVANGGAAAVVAVLNFTSPGTAWKEGPGYLIDWSAYFGGCADQGSREENLGEVAENTGNKITMKQAAYFFPTLPQDCFRQ